MTITSSVLMYGCLYFLIIVNSNKILLLLLLLFFFFAVKWNHFIKVKDNFWLVCFCLRSEVIKYNVSEAEAGYSDRFRDVVRRAFDLQKYHKKFFLNPLMIVILKGLSHCSLAFVRLRITSFWCNCLLS